MYERTYTEIGKVHYVTNSRAKRVILKVKPDSSVWITLPKFYSLEKAEAFMMSKSNWIFKTQEKLAKKIQTKLYVQDDEFITHFHKVSFVETECDSPYTKVSDFILKVHYSPLLNRDDESVQSVILEAIPKLLRKDAKDYFPNRLNELAEEFGFKYTSLRVTSAKTRWGSCSTRNSINLTIYLMRLPFELVDFVMLHELCHTVHKNHGPKFHALLESCSPGKKKEYEKLLRTHTIY